MSYTKNTWVTGDIITAEKLNNMERGLEEVHENFDGGVADWNENDETKPSYVKNRPFYTGELEEVVLFDGEMEIYSSGMANVAVMLDLVEGTEYIAIFNGTEYVTTATKSGNSLYLGNPSQFGGEDNGLPFSTMSGYFFSPNYSDTTCTFKVKTTVPKIYTLDKKYIPYKPGLIVSGEEFSTVVNKEDGELGETENVIVEAQSGAEIFNDYTGNVATGYMSHAEGYYTKASGTYAHTEGYGTIATGEGAHAEGVSSKATDYCAHAEGEITKAYGRASHTEGRYTKTTGDCSHAEGLQTIALAGQHVQGHYNDETIDTVGNWSGGTSGTAFIIGNGTSSTKSNACRITYQGQVIGKKSYSTSGADYAEYFEWADGNVENEDRVGYFVTFEDGELIRKANEGEYILGIVSGNPAVLGNHDECWLGKNEMDEWNRFIYVTETATDEKTGETTEYQTYKVNPEYDSTREYIPRADRPEWDAIGMIGVLSVRDDGTCKRNGYCKVADGGIATHSDEMTNIRVLSRVNENIVKVLFR